MKNILVISDLHCGHIAGLTPPGWQMRGEEAERHPRLAKQQRAMWEFYVRGVGRDGPFDVVLVNGDAIDGRGERSGGTELITGDRNEQIMIAAKCIREAMTFGKDGKPTTAVVMTRGTPYHTGTEENWEDNLAKEIVAAKIGDHEWPNVEGVVFDMRHFVGGSSVPHTRNTAISRERLWNTLWAERDQQPRADVLIRSHVHYHAYNGDRNHLNLTTPCLQGHGSRYGARQCSGTVDIGYLTFAVDGGGYSWAAHIMDGPVLRARELVL